MKMWIYFQRLRFVWLIVSAGMALSACTTVSKARLWLAPAMSGMQRVEPGLVLETPVLNSTLARAHGLQNAAAQLFRVVWPEPQSSPELWLCQTEVCYQRLGGGSPKAQSLGYSRTLLSPRGHSAGILAHEWWHAELWHRIGLTKVSAIPRWFDEGVAVWVGQETRHSENMYQRVLAKGIVPPRLDELVTFKDWNEAVGRYGDHLKAFDSEDVNVVYPTAGHEVRRWIGLVGVEGLRRLVDQVATGRDFFTVYVALEQEVRR